MVGTGEDAELLEEAMLLAGLRGWGEHPWTQMGLCVGPQSGQS